MCCVLLIYFKIEINVEKRSKIADGFMLSVKGNVTADSRQQGSGHTQRQTEIYHIYIYTSYM